MNHTIAVFILLAALLLAGVVGKTLENRRLTLDALDSIKTCSDTGQILRLFNVDNMVRTECFGELPDVDLHVETEKA